MNLNTYTSAYNPEHPDRKQYEEALQRRRKEHLEKVERALYLQWQPCLHDACPECVGTGIRRDGSSCVHCLSFLPRKL